MSRGQRLQGQRGAALLLAMIVMTLVATLASAMVWHQTRAVQLESAERARAQAGWILGGAIDWGREIWRRNAGDSPSGQQPWDLEVAEGRLSSFLAADREQSADVAVEAFLAGRVEDAQARYNLRNLVDASGKLVEQEVLTLRRLYEALGLPGSPEALAAALARAWGPAQPGSDAPRPLSPERIEQLAWLEVDERTLARLRSAADILPERTPINLNTASREVIYAVLTGADMASATRLVREPRNRFRTLQDVRTQDLVPKEVLDPDNPAHQARVAVNSRHVRVIASIRLEDRVLTEVALLRRTGAGGAVTVETLRRERGAGVPGRP